MKKLFLLLTFVFIILTSVAYADDYVIDNVFFSDMSGNVLENPTESCLINAEVTKTTVGRGTNTVVFVTYSDKGRMIGYTTVSGTINGGQTSDFSTLLNVSENVGFVKVMVWDSVTGQNPLAEQYLLAVDEIAAESYNVPYIPTTVTVHAKLVETPRINSGLQKHQYILADVYIPKNELVGTDEKTYNYCMKRLSAISEIYGLPLFRYGIVMNALSESDLGDYIGCDAYVKLNFEIPNEPRIVSFEPTNSNNCVYLDAEDYVPNADQRQTFEKDNIIKFSDRSYKTEQNLDVYINGVYYTSIDSTESGSNDFLDNLLKNSRGLVRLMKTGGCYNSIYVNYYNTAVVSSVKHSRGYTIFDVVDNLKNPKNLHCFHINDEDLEDVKVTLDGQKTGLSDIKEGDIISFRTDQSYLCQETIYEPSFLEIEVSREYVDGLLAEIDTYYHIFRVGKNDYEVLDFDRIFEETEIGETYRWYLDFRGRIAAFEQFTSNKKIAVLDSIDGNEITIITKEGKTESYTVDGSLKSKAETLLYGGKTEKVPVWERVIIYRTRPNGTLSAISPYGDDYLYKQGVVLKKQAGKFGSVGYNEYTVLADALTGMPLELSDLEDKVTYNVYAFEKLANSTVYHYILLSKTTAPGGGLTVDEDDNRAEYIIRVPDSEIYDSKYMKVIIKDLDDTERDKVLEYDVVGITEGITPIVSGGIIIDPEALENMQFSSFDDFQKFMMQYEYKLEDGRIVSD